MLKTLPLFAALLMTVLHAQNTATTNTPATNAPAAAPAIPLADVITRAQTDIATLKTFQAGLNPDPVADTARTSLPGISVQINDRLTDEKRDEGANPTLTSLQSSKAAWQTIADTLDETQASLTNRVRDLDQELWGTLARMEKDWSDALDHANTTKAPLELVSRIRDVQAEIDGTKKAIKADQAQLYSLQNQVATESSRVKTNFDAVNKQITSAQAQLLERNRPYLWDPASLSSQVGAVTVERLSLGQQVDALRTYLTEKAGAVITQVFLFALLIAMCHWIRHATHERAKKDPALCQAEDVFDMPVWTALLLALLVSGWLYPAAPPLLLAGIGAVAIIPAVIIIRRLLKRGHLPLLYATVAAYFIDQVRYVATPTGIFARLVFIGELAAVCLFILFALRSRRLRDANNSTVPSQLDRTVKVYLHCAYFIFLAAGFANVFGYVHLAFTVGNGALQASYLAIILYAATRVLDALALAAMALRPVGGFGMVRHHHDLVYQNVTLLLRWVVLAIWIVAALNLCSLYDPVVTGISAVAATQVKWGSLSFALGPLFLFPITVWASFKLSRFIQFVLEEEVYPHMSLARGIPYAASTVVHYAILVIGFFIALSAMGIHLSDYAVLAGAFGVGLGFGLQNIMNNFMSGLILLFERPIKVGDVVQFDANTIGKVERIGIRASVILLTNGSELIVPNGNLISNPVTNWTLSNCERLVEIPVNVTSKVDPQHVLDLLLGVARAHAAVLKNPPPQAIVVTLAAAITFRLRAWIDSEEDWMKVTSDLTLGVQSALGKENIVLG